MLLEIIKNLNWTQIIVAILSLLGIGFCINKYSPKQQQKSGNKSVNCQANGNINIGITKDD